MGEEALLIIDMLNDFVREGAPLEVENTRKVIPSIQRELRRARADKVPVMYLSDTHTEDDGEFKRFGWPPHAVKGTEGAKIVDELAPAEDDIIIEKTTYSGFYKSGLEDALKKLGIKRLRLTGCVTHICVLFTASDAVLRGYDVEVPADGVAGLADEDHEAGLRIMKDVLGVKIV